VVAAQRVDQLRGGAVRAVGGLGARPGRVDHGGPPAGRAVLETPHAPGRVTALDQPPVPVVHQLGAAPGGGGHRARQSRVVALDPRHPAAGVDGLDEVAVGVVAQPDGDVVGVGDRGDQAAADLQPGDPAFRVDDLGRDAFGVGVGEPGAGAGGGDRHDAVGVVPGHHELGAGRRRAPQQVPAVVELLPGHAAAALDDLDRVTPGVRSAGAACGRARR
jgi:hypothetical protein